MSKKSGKGDEFLRSHKVLRDDSCNERDLSTVYGDYQLEDSKRDDTQMEAAIYPVGADGVSAFGCKLR